MARTRETKRIRSLRSEAEPDLEPPKDWTPPPSPIFASPLTPFEWQSPQDVLCHRHADIYLSDSSTVLNTLVRIIRARSVLDGILWGSTSSSSSTATSENQVGNLILRFLIIQGLPETERETRQHLCELMFDQGLFVPPDGELAVEHPRLIDLDDFVGRYNQIFKSFETISRQGDFQLFSEQSSVPSYFTKEVCRYGTACYRKNKDHLARFSHPHEIQEPTPKADTATFCPELSRLIIAIRSHPPLCCTDSLVSLVSSRRQRIHVSGRISSTIIFHHSRFNFLPVSIPVEDLLLISVNIPSLVQLAMHSVKKQRLDITPLFNKLSFDRLSQLAVVDHLPLRAPIQWRQYWNQWVRIGDRLLSRDGVRNSETFFVAPTESVQQKPSLRIIPALDEYGYSIPSELSAAPAHYINHWMATMHQYIRIANFSTLQTGSFIHRMVESVLIQYLRMVYQKRHTEPIRPSHRPLVYEVCAIKKNRFALMFEFENFKEGFSLKSPPRFQFYLMADAAREYIQYRHSPNADPSLLLNPLIDDQNDY